MSNRRERQHPANGTAERTPPESRERVPLKEHTGCFLPCCEDDILMAEPGQKELCEL